MAVVVIVVVVAVVNCCCYCCWIRTNSNVELGTDPWMEDRLRIRDGKSKNEKQQAKNVKRREKSLPGQISIANSASLRARDLKTSQKKDLSSAYDIARLSTASMGKFDRKLSFEPKQNEIKPSRKDKRAIGSAVNITNMEKDTSKDVLKRVLRVEAQRKQKVVQQAAKVFQKTSEKQNRADKKRKITGVVGRAKDSYKKKKKFNHEKQ